MFGRLPASGLYVRHVQGLRLHHVEFAASSPEQRPTLVCDDTEDLEVHSMRATAPSSTQPIVRLHNCRDVFLHGNRSPTAAGPFLHVTGKRSAALSQSANDLSRAASPATFADGASSAILTLH